MGLVDEISGLMNGILGGAADGEKAGGEEANLMAALQADGVQVESWIGAGENQPVSADDITEGLSGPALAAIAGTLGVDPSTASALLSRVRPGLSDRRTPDGQDPGTPDDSQTS